MQNEPRVLFDGLHFPESLRWNQGNLWFCEMYRGTVWMTDLVSPPQQVAQFDDHVGGLGFMPDGSVLIVLKQTRRLMRVTDDRAELHANLDTFEGDHLNDMVVDDRGRAYVTARKHAAKLSAKGPDQQETEDDCLMLVEPDGSFRVATDRMLTPNGLVITQGGRFLIAAETRACRLTRFVRDPETGALGGRTRFADLGDVRPDGICLDTEGGVWVGSPNTAQFVRVLEGRGIVRSVPVPGKFAVACMLGGKDRRTLFLATAVTSWEQIARHESVGFLEALEVEEPGAGLP